jgi:flagellin-specific chaperone FliS
MWQVEDIIRAYGCSLTRLRHEYIDRFEYTEEQKEELADWYGNLVNMMRREGKTERGHLQINTIIVQDMGEMNARLLESSKFPFYNAEYYRVLPFIVELRNRGGKEYGEIETCLNALYGTMMLRLQKKEISQETTHAVKEISTFIGMLSDYYLKDKTEGIDWDE